MNNNVFQCGKREKWSTERVLPATMWATTGGEQIAKAAAWRGGEEWFPRRRGDSARLQDADAAVPFPDRTRQWRHGTLRAAARVVYTLPTPQLGIHLVVGEPNGASLTKRNVCACACVRECRNGTTLPYVAVGTYNNFNDRYKIKFK